MDAERVRHQETIASMQAAGEEAQRAWEHPKMAAGHARRVAQYYERFERPGSAARRAIEAAARRMNDNFRCPRERLRRQPRTKFDCFVTEAEGTCVA